MSKKNKEAADFWNKVSAEQSEAVDMRIEQYERDIAHNKEGISAERVGMQMGRTTTPKVKPHRDKK